MKEVQTGHITFTIRHTKICTYNPLIGYRDTASKLHRFNMQLHHDIDTKSCVCVCVCVCVCAEMCYNWYYSTQQLLCQHLH
jgi:hypothetical protein